MVARKANEMISRTMPKTSALGGSILPADVPVDVAVDGAGPTGSERAAEQCGPDQRQRGPAVSSDDHGRDGGDEQQFDDAGFGEHEVGPHPLAHPGVGVGTGAGSPIGGGGSRGGEAVGQHGHRHRGAPEHGTAEHVGDDDPGSGLRPDVGGAGQRLQQPHCRSHRREDVDRPVALLPAGGDVQAGEPEPEDEGSDPVREVDERMRGGARRDDPAVEQRPVGKDEGGPPLGDVGAQHGDHQGHGGDAEGLPGQRAEPAAAGREGVDGGGGD